jgi:hypothetical protein
MEHEKILNRIDETLEWYETDKKMSAEDALVYGLQSAVDRGWLSQAEMDAYLEAYTANRNLNSSD